MVLRLGHRLTLQLLIIAAAIAGGTLSVAAQSLGQPIGTDLANETCRIQGAPSLINPAALVCGDNVQTGHLSLSAVEALKAGDDRALAQDVERIFDSTLAMQCDVAWSGQDAAMLTCRLQSTNWPHIVVTYLNHGSLYCADGMPSMLPVLETAIAQTTGHVIPAARGLAQSVQRHRSQIGCRRSGCVP
jgi:hypothetical protein